jgi:hypothetical protein
MAVEANALPFGEAIDFLKGKVNLPTAKWDDLRHGAHVRAFSVAGVTRDDMLADFRAAIEKAREKGAGLAEFRKDFDAIVDRTGWQFNARGSTEEERRAWRARIIYKTNMRTSYMAGRYKQMTDPDVLKYRPYWQYKHSDAMHPRLLHLSWDGRVLLATDPAWKVMFPPNGWGCGCDVVALSRRQLKALGKTGPDPAPDLKPYEAKDPRTGQTESRYAGIDRGWEYNVGEEWLNGMVPRQLQEPLAPFSGEKLVPAPNLDPLPPPTQIDAAELLPEGLPVSDYVAAFLDVFGMQPGEIKLHRDTAGGVITISERMLQERDIDGNFVQPKADKFGRGPLLRLVAHALLDPDEIWVNWYQTATAVELRRSYLKQFIVGKNRPMFARFEWGKSGWIAVTGYSPTLSQLNRERVGAMLYRRS